MRVLPGASAKPLRQTPGPDAPGGEFQVAVAAVTRAIGLRQARSAVPSVPAPSSSARRASRRRPRWGPWPATRMKSVVVPARASRRARPPGGAAGGRVGSGRTSDEIDAQDPWHHGAAAAGRTPGSSADGSAGSGPDGPAAGRRRNRLSAARSRDTAGTTAAGARSARGMAAASAGPGIGPCPPSARRRCGSPAPGSRPRRRSGCSILRSRRSRCRLFAPRARRNRRRTRRATERQPPRQRRSTPSKSGNPLIREVN